MRTLAAEYDVDDDGHIGSKEKQDLVFSYFFMYYSALSLFPC